MYHKFILENSFSGIEILHQNLPIFCQSLAAFTCLQILVFALKAHFHHACFPCSSPGWHSALQTFAGWGLRPSRLAVELDTLGCRTIEYGFPRKTSHLMGPFKIATFQSEV